MKLRPLLLFITAFSISNLLYGQNLTWNGSASTAWNTAANWTPSAVPTAASNITIPGTATITNWPKITGATSMNSLTMQEGSSIDFNGFALNCAAGFNINGATLNNTNTSGDIVLTATAGNNYFSKSIVNDNIFITTAAAFYEARIAGNTYNGHANFNHTGTGGFYLCELFPSTFKGNLNINRTTAGNDYIFANGHSGITGNFNYINNAGGTTYINNASINTGIINGQINITADKKGTSNFTLRKLSNNTPGGTVSILGAADFHITDNILKSTVSVDSLVSWQAKFFTGNTITGNVSIGDAPSSTGQWRIGNNNITGNTVLNINSSSQVLEGHGENSNYFNGNVSVNITGTSQFYSSYNSPSYFGGNLTINRTTAGNDYIFVNGHSGITGNFNYINNAGGTTYINNASINTEIINGQINITADKKGTSHFTLRKLSNNTPGGTVSILGAADFHITDNILKSTVSVDSLVSWQAKFFTGNTITGNVSMGDAPSSTGQWRIGNNNITGNTVLNINSSSQVLEGHGENSNYFNGNVSVNITGTSQFYSSYNSPSYFGGNLIINRTGAGNTWLFYSGHSGILGNLSLTNSAGGEVQINQLNSISAAIEGQINIDINNAGQLFGIHSIHNKTAGGSIIIKNPGGVIIENNTLNSNIAVSQLYTWRGMDIFKNTINGNTSLRDSSISTGPVDIYSNTFNGNTLFTQMGSTWTDGHSLSGNIYNGDLLVNKISNSIFYFANNFPSYISQAFRINTISNFTIRDSLIFTGASNSIIDQLGTQAIQIPDLVINKTGGATLTLNDPVSITKTLDLNSGNIIASAINNVYLLDNAVAVNASAMSKVVGYVVKQGNDAFTFPVGTATSYNPIAITAPGTISDVFIATYRHSNPHTAGYDTTKFANPVKRVSGCEYWLLERTAGTSNVNVTLHYNEPCAGGDIYATNSSNLTVMRWNGTAWVNEGNSARSGTTTGTVTSNVVSSFSPFTLGSLDLIQNPLPVQLISFEASSHNSYVQLTWATATEINSDYFEVEKSSDGVNYRFVTRMNAKGNNSNYTATDNNPGTGVVFYRLKMLDKDGTIEYSETRKVAIAPSGNIVSVYPNPAKSLITIESNADIKAFIIYNIQGVDQTQNVMIRRKSGSSFEVNVSKLAPGMYLVRTENGTFNFIKQ